MHNDYLYVDWHLLDGQNHECPYSHEPESAASETFSRENILETAYRLLAFNRPEYIFHFYGGEPTIHPYFAELVRYIITSGRNSHLIVDTNGLRKLEYYVNLLNVAHPGQICFNINVHLQYMELAPLLHLIAIITGKGQYCRVILNHIDEYTDQARIISEKLALFRKATPFVMEMRFPMGGSAAWLPQVVELFSQANGPALKIPEWTKEISVTQDSNPQGFFCVGINSCHIKPDGSCCIGFEENDQSFSARIEQNGALRRGMPSAPAFSDLKQAENWLADFNKRAVNYLLEAEALRHPLEFGINDEQSFLLKLKNLHPEGKTAQCPAIPDLLAKRMADVLLAFSILEDEESRRVFLGKIKTQLTGNLAYLDSSAYPLYQHPHHSYSDGTHFRANEKDFRLIRIEKNDSPEDVSRILPRVKFHQSNLEALLPKDKSWLDIVLEVHNSLPDYRIFLGQHGSDTVLYASPGEQRKHFGPLKADKEEKPPLLSIIVSAGNGDGLENSLQSILNMGLEDYEAIVVFDNFLFSSPDNINGFIKESQWRIRPLYISGTGNIFEAFEAGLDLARGDYAYFLPGGSALEADTLANTVKVLKQENADLAVVSPNFSEIISMEGKEALKYLFSGSAEMNRCDSMVYRVSLLQDYTFRFMDISSYWVNAWLNVPVLYFAKKIILAPGNVIDNGSEENAQAGGYSQFLQLAQTLADFHNAHVDWPACECGKYLLDLFKRGSGDILRSVIGADKQISSSDIEILFGIPNIGSLLLTELSRKYDASNLVENVEKVNDCHTGHEVVFKENDFEYPVTFIIMVDKKQAFECLEQVLKETGQIYECIIIDNANNVEIAEKLELITEIYYNARLYRMDKKATLSQCLNTGIGMARGKVIAFLNGCLGIIPELGELANKAASEEAYNVFAIAAQYNDDGNIKKLQINSKICSLARFLEACFTSAIDPEYVLMLYRRSYIMEQGIKFDPYAPNPKMDFILRAAKNTEICILTSPGTISIKQLPASQVYPEGFNRFLAMHAELENIIAESKWGNASRLNLQKWVTRHLEEELAPLNNQQNPDCVKPNIEKHLPRILWQPLLNAYSTAILDKMDN